MRKWVYTLQYLLLLEDICVFPQAQLAEELGQVWTFQRRVQAATVAAGYRRDAVHVIAAAEIMLCGCPLNDWGKQEEKLNENLEASKTAATINSYLIYQRCKVLPDHTIFN